MKNIRSPQNLRRRVHRSASTGFSLVEIVVVVAIVALIFTFATPYTLAAIQSASISSAGDSLMLKLSQAQQRALTDNKPTGVDFFFYTKDGITGCHAIQLIRYDPATNQATSIEEPVYWGEGRVVLVQGALSPMFASNVPASSTGSATRAPFKDLEATFNRIIFYPNGSTNLRVPLRNAYLTLVSINNYKEELADAPPNYYTVQLDPVTGRAHSYRP
ncbi:Verru_Chthon cassette protein D [Prosthecobacter sp.]|uniref:Verru_Chthon cassette protein D n=1 Tax=Prosthecobacter sp. TaxID=1965333 RepID=UPI001DBDF66A|nr:Verru_Chthon cassette protein D [Prosthecobacter sp.]MCB1276480.1 Verru_Chthon cassette protein D [Prosthecobacter sp.]